MSPPEKKNKSTEIAELEQSIRRHNKLYFVKQSPEIPDYEFDRLVVRLRKLKPDSPVLQEIPSDVAGGVKVTHRSPMLSLDKCYTDEDLEDWAKKLTGDIVATPKIDGCAVELRYDATGKLALGATRGDGVMGEDITPNVRMIADIPQQISQGPTEVRGEIYMRLAIFKKRKEEGFSNPRNLAAGAIKQKDPRKTKDYQLSFFGYDLLGLGLKTEEEKFSLLKKFKIPTVELQKVSRDHLRGPLEYFLKRRAQYDFETDGVVYKANLVSEQGRLAFTAHHPRYAIAYKFQGDTGTTVLHQVEWSVSRTGTITPIGIVEPVELSGAMVSRVSLHNLGLMQKLGLRKGSKVLMVRSGGVIPKLESVVEAGKGEEFYSPQKCPSCGEPTEIRDDFLYCTNAQGCRRAKVGELEHFIKTIECDGFGDKLIEQLYDTGLVQDPADFFTLEPGDLLELERMGETLATKLLKNIQEKKRLPLDVFLRALAIRELAKHTSKILMKEFKTLETILAVVDVGAQHAVPLLSNIHTIGPVIAKEVVAGLKRKRGLIEGLLKYVKIGMVGATHVSPLHGKKFLFTGSLSIPRGEAEKKVEALGGEIAGTVTQDLDYLVVGTDPGSKADKAKKLQAKGAKVQILTESEWQKMFH